MLALTPVATLMFRFNNPDALLVLLLVGAAYATLRAVEDSLTTGTPHTRWLALGGALVGRPKGRRGRRRAPASGCAGCRSSASSTARRVA